MCGLHVETDGGAFCYRKWLKVKDVLPRPVASPSEYESLLLSDFELVEFQKRKPLKSFLLDLEHPLPTALHSWGSQVLSCPCGCRAAFSERRLNKGICAVLEPCATTGATNFRHMTAREVALLSGLSPLYQLGDNPRLALSLVGQLASPLQSAWIGSHLAQALRALGLPGLCKDEPVSLLL